MCDRVERSPLNWLAIGPTEYYILNVSQTAFVHPGVSLFSLILHFQKSSDIGKSAICQHVDIQAGFFSTMDSARYPVYCDRLALDPDE